MPNTTWHADILPPDNTDRGDGGGGYAPPPQHKGNSWEGYTTHPYWTDADGTARDDGASSTPHTNPRDLTGRDAWEDQTAYGGAARSWDKNGNLLPGTADVATQRYQGMGAAAAQRQAYQADYGTFAGEMGQSQGARGAQTDALGLQQQAAMGNAPSQAQILGRNMIDQSLQAQMAGAASARGGSMAQAAAMRQAQSGAAAQQQQGVNNLSALRAQEMSQARDAYMQGASGIRAQDFTGAGLGLQQSGQQIQNEQFQRQLNQQGQEYYEGLGNQVQEDQMRSSMGEHSLTEQGFEQQRAVDESSEQQIAKNILGGGGSGAGAMMGAMMMSDARAKQEIRPMYSDEETKIDETGDGSTSGMSSAEKKKMGQAMLSAATADAQGGGDAVPAPTPVAQTPDPSTVSMRAQGLDSTSAREPISMGPHSQLHAMYSDVGSKDVLPIGAEPEGRQLYIDDSGRGGYRALGESQPQGASLSGPAPRYSIAQAAAERRELPKAERKMTADELAAWADKEIAATKAKTEAIQYSKPAVGQAYSEGYGMARAAMMGREDAPMANANRALVPSSYSYKPEFRPPGQAPGEKNVGPMAQNMAADPVAGTAVYRDPNSGMLAIDRDKALKLSMGGVGALQQQYDAQQAQIDELRRRQGVR